MPKAPALLLSILLSSVAITAPAAAQERVAVGSGVMPEVKPNSPARPIGFAAGVPAGAAIVLPLSSMAELGKAGAGLPADTLKAIEAAATAARFDAKPLSTLKLHGVGGYPTVLLVGVEPGLTARETALADAGGKAIHCLVKGSRGSAMDRIVEALLAQEETASHVA